ncbi:pentapeptide repeat-containing protein [Streptomyces sp. RTd22]|uniref:pentapeptide repeat-containing protein n=1 Tax=Streptomyces sp. RTd22 TaxID=1841249 RepID=UPI0007C5BEDF|nr:pentapeptide repeat-containing protein [Streptomyces sp. RTd22]
MAQVTRRGGSSSRIKNPSAPNVSPTLRLAEMPGDGLDDDATVKGVRFDGTHFNGLEVEAAEAEGCAFENLRFTGTRLRRSQFSNCTFDTCDFAEVAAHDVSLIRCTVAGSRITGSSWSHGTFRDVRFEGCVSAPAMYRHSKLYSVVFSECRMQGSDFQSSHMHNVLFRGCDLTGSQWANCQVGTVRFEDCTLIDVGGAASLKGATVQGPGSMELALSLAREAGILFE